MRPKGELDQLVGEFTGVFTNANGNLFAETYNQLNAYFATVPGNYAQKLRTLYLLNTNCADLSFLFTILASEKRNAHLDADYLAVLQTDNATPYFFNLHTAGKWGSAAQADLGYDRQQQKLLLQLRLRALRSRGSGGFGSTNLNEPGIARSTAFAIWATIGLT